MENFDKKAENIIQEAESELEALIDEKSFLREEISLIEQEAKNWEKIVKTIKNSPIKAKNTIFGSEEEKQVFKKLLSILKSKECRVWGQVSCSAFLNAEKRDTWFTYNTLYVDFLISKIDKENKNEDGKPICVIEYDGIQHEEDKLQKTRDKIKDIACSQARIPIVRLKYDEVEENIIKGKMIQEGFDKTYFQ